MVERTPVANALAYMVLVAGAAVMLAPLYLAFATATVAPDALQGSALAVVPGSNLIANLSAVWARTELAQQLINSVVVVVIVVAGKLLLASLTAFAIVYFRSPFSGVIFWAVLITLMLPLELRIVPTYEAAANALQPIQTILDWSGLAFVIEAVSGLEVRLAWNLLDTYWGLTLPLIATATGTFLFRQFYCTVPPELVEAAQLDGAGPMRFFIDILVPLSAHNFAALATIVFIDTWNQYLWPLLITTDAKMRTAVVGVASMQPNAAEQLPEWNLIMAATLVVMLPPILVIALLQRWFVRGLLGTAGKGTA